MMGSERKSRSLARNRGTCFSIALIALTLTACGTKEETEAAPAAAVVAANTAKATVEPFTRTTSAIGTVVARPGSYAALSAPAPTRVAKVFVAEGQRVARGAPLVEFEQVGFTMAASAAQSALTAAERNHERAQRLAREGILPRKDEEAAAAELGRARSDAALARREQQLSVLRSPVSGVVTRMTAVLGAPADAGQVLVEIADPSAFDITLSVAPADAGALRPGARVALFAGEKSRGEPLGDGRVLSVGATVDTTSRAVTIRVAVPKPRRALRLAESVYGEIAVETRPNAVVVPVAALVPEGNGYKVFVVGAKGTAIARDVKVGGRTETLAEILEGLSGGETIVTQGAYGMEDSVKVSRPVPVKP